MTINLKRLLLLTGSLLAPATGLAESKDFVGAPAVMLPSPELDLAPVSTNNGSTRLRRTDQIYEGNGMPTAAMFADGINGLYFSMNTELPATTPGGPVREANHRMQLAAVPFSLIHDAATDTIGVRVDPAQSKYVTNNNGDEYRNANSPIANTVKVGTETYVCAKYNYQPQNNGNTKAYLQCFNQAGVAVLPQAELFAKNNDDCFMTQDGSYMSSVSRSATTTRLSFYAGCNGNGADDGWVVVSDLTCSSPTTCTLTKVADVSVCPREERSRGKCSIGTDPNTAICTWTEGNTQPQRDGVWIAAVNVGDGQNGANAQSRLLWKQKVAGRVEVGGRNTYAMRMKQERMVSVDASGNFVPDAEDRIILQWGGLEGNNNANGKGGTYYTNMMAVVKATAAGLTYEVEPTDIAEKVIGLDGTHLGATFGLFGTEDALKPGITFLGGSHTGGGNSSQARIVTYDAVAKTFVDGGMRALAPHDRHLYPNYLGNNPGNQGRNHSFSTMIKSPFAASKHKYLQIFATSGKEQSTVMNPAKKLSAFLTVLPIAEAKAVTPPPSGEEPSTPEPQDPTTPDDGGSTNDDGGTSLGGCSTTGSAGGFASTLLVGLAALIRRRRR